MTSYVYPSAFSDNLASLETPPTSRGVAGTTSASTSSNALVIATPASTTLDDAGATSQGLGSFICHVAYLENKIQRGGDSTFFSSSRCRVLTRERVANGASFIVERAELEGGKPEARATVAIKTVREDRFRQNQWREILLEIRALLHEPLRYHPNIVRLLDIRWDARIDSRSPFPAIIQEYAAFGTLDKLQQRSKPLPFSIKQKLCYEVGRALSIIHACGMVHGDLKHENILIFPNPYPEPSNQPYTAKLADFGGTVMDFGSDSARRIPMHTFPYEAPEISDNKLTEEGAKKTDAYSYGMLIWRCMIDAQDILSAIGLSRNGQGSVADAKLQNDVKLLKLSDGLLESAIHSVTHYFFTHGLPKASLGVVSSALMFTLRGDPNQRALDRAQVRLRGMDSVAAHFYVGVKDEANRKTIERSKYKTPGRHGMDLDSVGFALGRLGNDYDAQNNLPGFRPDLPRPEAGSFLFEPLTLRNLLDRSQQEAMIRDFELYANSPVTTGAGADEELRIEPWSAAFYLFQSYLCGFGVPCDPEKACSWLRRAAEPSMETGTTDYLAMAWMNRVHAALGVSNHYNVDKQLDNLFWSVVRGHRHCAEDAETIIRALGNLAQMQAWRRRMAEAEEMHRCLTGSTGMPFFAPRKLSRAWDLNDLNKLDMQLKDELGAEYASCLRPPPGSEDEPSPPQDGGYRFDRIFVNHVGHGLLHMAAVMGKLRALRHLYGKYLCDLNLKNQSHSDTPLICACRTGRLDVALWCLKNGADPNGGEFCEESPLHCISAFDEFDMEIVVAKLMAAGADIEKPSEASRKDVRGILADWEDNFSITFTPLGRAVLKQSLPAVKVLLKHGASPTGKRVYRNRANISPVELAAVLTLPDILEELLRHVDDAVPVWDECEMLDAAHSGQITPYDSLSLQSRLVRCGVHYKENLVRILRLLCERRERGAAHHGKPEPPPGKHLCNEILLGNTDIVSALLALGHSGSPEFRPLCTAAKANHTAIFQLLASHDPPDASDLAPLLSATAERFPHAPCDLTIARYLLSRGCPPDTSTPTQPSPLVIGIENGYFDLADLLIVHGAGSSLNDLLEGDHPTPCQGSDSTTTEPSVTSQSTTTVTTSYTLLGRLARNHTSSSLRAITYLAHLHKSPEYIIHLSPLSHRTVTHFPTASSDTTSGTSSIEDISVIHALAMLPTDKWTAHGQISASIVQTLLALFPGSDSLGTHPTTQPALGSPVMAAVRAGNVEVFRALLASPGYMPDIHETQRVVASSTTTSSTKMNVDGGIAEAAADGTELMLLGDVAWRCAGDMLLVLEKAAVPACGDENIDKGEVQDWESKVKLLRRRVEIAREVDQFLFLGDGEGHYDKHEDGEAEDGKTKEGDGAVWREVDWEGRIRALEQRLKTDFKEPVIDRVSEWVHLPADLSVLTDEKPTGWREDGGHGEMTEEMALKIFLNLFRADNQLYGDEIAKAMGKMFNKRSDGDGNGRDSGEGGRSP